MSIHVAERRRSRHRAVASLMACVAAAWLAAAHAGAQVAPPNAAGVSMGHLHYRVKDVAANTTFWTALGGTAITIGKTQAIRFPDVIVMLEQGDYTGTSEGAVLNHVAFRVRTFTQVEAAGLKVDRLAQFPGVGYTYTPERERVELFEDAALNLTFTPDDGPAAGVAARHNAPLATPVAFHHVHLYLPDEAHLEAKAWYARTFGGVAGKRAQYDAVDLPGINFNFSGGRTGEPMKNRTLRHLGLEVRNLQAFAARLESLGVRFDVPVQKGPDGVSLAVLTDPWGTTIELTEGLHAF